MPSSSNKRQQLVKKLFLQTFGDNVLVQSRSPRKIKAGNIRRQLVEEFYCCNDINRQAPGKRDVKSIKNVKTGMRERI